VKKLELSLAKIVSDFGATLNDIDKSLEEIHAQELEALQGFQLA